MTDRAISPIISAGIAAQRGRNIVNIRLYAVKLDRTLSEAERSTLARFLPPERQDRIKTSEPLCAYALLCRALHELYGLEDLPQLSYGEHGKPYFASHPDVHFSLSHTRGAVLLAVHNEPIGADIECLRPVSGAMRTRFHAANDPISGASGCSGRAAASARGSAPSHCGTGKCRASRMSAFSRSNRSPTTPPASVPALMRTLTSRYTLQ